MVAAAKERGLRLILTLVNGWDDFGGIQQYADWAGVSPKEEFFSSPECFRMYFSFVTVRRRIGTSQSIPHVRV